MLWSTWLQHVNVLTRPVQYHTLIECKPEITISVVAFLPVSESRPLPLHHLTISLHQTPPPHQPTLSSIRYPIKNLYSYPKAAYKIAASGATIESRLSLVGADRSQNPKSPADCGAVVRESEVSVQLSRGVVSGAKRDVGQSGWTAEDARRGVGGFCLTFAPLHARRTRHLAL
ncbi:hypothetical protein EVAR_100434_1 [Eumeta japonica]|uniref:Uncharacterized protein n=1 Tax=Eumeta variegata TaxID=151549 RepID=A0A4C2A6B1_EUMVA|nr:hypothetical protein EVAR_100434_1 [Eumeta japonica]